jgi:hypothetical protein
MKKRCIVLAFIGIAAVGLSADGFGRWTFGVWGEADFVPLKISVPKEGDAKITTGAGPDYMNGADVGFELGASLDDRIGFHLFLQPYHDGLVHLGWSAHGWVKPFDWITLRVGRFDVAELRGTNGDGDGKDAVFSRFASRSLDGVHVAITPLRNLWLGMMVQPGIIDVPEKENDAEDTYKNAQIGIGYWIPQIGFVRAQYIGNALWIANEADPDWIRYEAAFNLTAVKNFDIDLGIKIPQNAAVQGFDVQIAAVTAYSMNSIGLTGRVDVQFKDDPYYKLFIGPQYTIGTNITVGGDIVYSATANAEDDTLGIGAYLKKTFGPKSFIKAGLKTVFPIGENQEYTIVSFPVSFEWTIY